MTILRTRDEPRTDTAGPGALTRSGPRGIGSQVSRRQAMLWSLGALLVIIGSLGSLALARAGDQREAVLVMARSVPAGQQITADDLTVAEVASDDLTLVAESQQASIVGLFARVRLIAGQPLASELVQPDPLISAGAVVIAVPVTAVQLPAGVRERSVVDVVVPANSTLGGGIGDAVTARGVVVEFPSFDGAAGVGALSVEVDPADATAVVSAGRDVSIVLVAPGETEVGE